MEPKKSTRHFQVVFAIILFVAALSTIGNLMEYKRMDKLETEGKRIYAPVDSIVTLGAKTEIFVRFNVDGREYCCSKKVKSKVALGDTVPLYYLPKNPGTHAISLE